MGKRERDRDMEANVIQWHWGGWITISYAIINERSRRGLLDKVHVDDR